MLNNMNYIIVENGIKKNNLANKWLIKKMKMFLYLDFSSTSAYKQFYFNNPNQILICRKNDELITIYCQQAWVP